MSQPSSISNIVAFAHLLHFICIASGILVMPEVNMVNNSTAQTFKQVAYMHQAWVITQFTAI
jgi:hypothetical protein